MIWIIMGVSGSGKSSVGEELARRLGVPFVEGDHLHPPANREKMASGTPLDDRDRAPWLDDINARLRSSSTDAIYTCSALKSTYRDRLTSGVVECRFVYLRVSQTAAEQRVGRRAKHFFSSSSLVHSQFEALEEPTDRDDVIVVDGQQELDQVVTFIIDKIKSRINNQS